LTKKIDDFNRIEKSFEKSIKVILDSKNLVESIQKTIEIITKCLKNNGKIILMGNGGSAADSQHFAAELIGRFKHERRSLPAISLTTDTSIITALSNDYSVDVIFSRQCEALVDKKDTVIAISTSGKSKNVINAVKTSKNKGAKIISMIGKNTDQLSEFSDIVLSVPSESTPQIQEVHRILMHIICEIVEEKFVNQ